MPLMKSEAYDDFAVLIFIGPGPPEIPEPCHRRPDGRAAFSRTIARKAANPAEGLRRPG